MAKCTISKQTPTGTTVEPVEDSAVERGAGKDRRTVVQSLLLFGLLLAIYNLNGDFLPVNDAKPNAYLPISVLTEGNLSFTPKEAPFMFAWKLKTTEGFVEGNIDRWSDRIGERTASELYQAGLLEPAGERYYIVPTVHNGHYVGIYGPGAGLTALPFFALLHLADGNLSGDSEVLWFGAKFVAAASVAGSAALIFLTVTVFTGRRRAWVIALVYGLGTCVWSVSSQTLWQHGPNVFFLSLGTFFLLRPRTGWRSGFLCGLAYGFAVFCRPASAAVMLAVGVFLLVTRRRPVLTYALGGMLPVCVLCMYNTHYLGSPLQFGQTERGKEVAEAKTGSRDSWQTPLWKGLAFHLLSPSRGLLIYSPVLIFAFWGIVRTWRGRSFAVFRPLTLALLGQFLLASKWFDSWGGWSFGYRLVVDTTPFFAVLLVPVVGWISTRRPALVLFVLLFSWSVLVQFVGAHAYNSIGWNAREAYAVSLPGEGERLTYDIQEARSLAVRTGSSVAARRLDIDRPEHRHRLWSVVDSQIPYYLAHFNASREFRRKLMREWLRSPSR